MKARLDPKPQYCIVLTDRRVWVHRLERAASVSVYL